MFREKLRPRGSSAENPQPRKIFSPSHDSSDAGAACVRVLGKLKRLRARFWHGAALWDVPWAEYLRSREIAKDRCSIKPFEDFFVRLFWCFLCTFKRKKICSRIGPKKLGINLPSKLLSANRLTRLKIGWKVSFVAFLVFSWMIFTGMLQMLNSLRANLFWASTQHACLNGLQGPWSLC